MKKIIILSLVLIALGLITAPIKAQAADCVWRPYPGNECQKNEIKKDSSNCPGEQPAGKYIAPGEIISPGCCCKNLNYTEPTPTPPKFTMPEFQISIPGLKLTPAESIQTTDNGDGTYSFRIPWLSEYILAIYNYGLSIAGILAAIVLMGGGALWLVSGGDASRVTQAKELIIGSVTGVIILFTSYIILYQINPELTKLQSIGLGTIKMVDLQPNPENTADFSAKCVAQTTGPCAVANMSVFGEKASQASAICNAESSGNAAIFNKSTKCAGGEYAVWGLFQFNLSANKFTDGNGVVLNCPAAFNNKAWTNKSPNCTVVNTQLYNQCVAAATNPALSISNAYKLAGGAKTNWGPWEANSKWCHFK